MQRSLAAATTRRLVALTGMGVWLAPAAFCQTSGVSSFPTRTELVDVDVLVLDGDGRPVRGLAKHDFLVTEDGRPLEIAAFDAPPAERRVAAGPARVPASPAMPDAGAVGRHVLLVVDDVHLTPFGAYAARRALVPLVKEQLRDGDRITFITTSGDTWWSATLPDGREDLLALAERVEAHRLAVGPFGDVETMAFAQGRHPCPTLRCFKGGRSVLLESPQAAAQGIRIRADAVMRTLARVLGAVEDLRGSKTVILVSEGFAVGVPASEIGHLVERARRAQVVIHFLDAGEPNDPTVWASAENAFRGENVSWRPQRDLAATTLAVGTGGAAFHNSAALQDQMTRLMARVRSSYWLGIVPSAASRDGGYRAIEVRVNRPGAEVHARGGYQGQDPSAAAAGGPQPFDARLLGALDGPGALGDVPLRLAAAVPAPNGDGTTTVTLVGEANGTALRRAGGADRGEAEWTLAVAARDGDRRWLVQWKVDLGGIPDGSADTAGSSIRRLQTFDLLPGRYRARLVVRALPSGRVGAVSRIFSVPAAGVPAPAAGYSPSSLR